MLLASCGMSSFKSGVVKWKTVLQSDLSKFKCGNLERRVLWTPASYHLKICEGTLDAE